MRPNTMSAERQLMRAIFETTCLGLITASLMVQPLSGASTSDASRSLPSPPSSVDQRKWKQPMPEEKQALHLLNRITFGPRPGDLERVQEMGVKAFLNQQLHPERIDDSAVEARVANLPSLSMSAEELVEMYPAPQQVAKLAARSAGAPPVGAEQKPEKMETTPSQPARPMMQPRGPQGPQRVITELAQEEILRAVYSNRQLQEVMAQFWMNHFNIFAPKGADRWLTTSFERDVIRPHAMGKFEDLLVATAESPAMLFYLDNWLSATPHPTYGNNGQRPGAAASAMARNRYGVWRPFGPPLGRGPFANPRAQTPAAQRRVPGQGNAPKQNRRGLNENYARELMELHTLGVDGGYTQKDVIEVARCLTGWTVDRPQQGGGFIFRPQMHDFGEKIVLGQKVKAGRGMEDGLQVLHIVAHHPATAQFISLKLCQRFVADDPPPDLVNRAAKTFLKTNGDIRQVLKNILTSREFYSEAAYRAKVKSPLELMASSLRALGAQTDASVQLIQMIARMGQPMFQYQAPTGFPDRASTWINSGSLLTRINFATQLAANRIAGTAVDWNALAPAASDPTSQGQNEFVQELALRLVGGDLSEQTRDAIQANLNHPDGATNQLPAQREKVMVAGLLLASPEFQRR